jgi:hypothetical protein
VARPRPQRPLERTRRCSIETWLGSPQTWRPLIASFSALARHYRLPLLSYRDPGWRYVYATGRGVQGGQNWAPTPRFVLRTHTLSQHACTHPIGPLVAPLGAPPLCCTCRCRRDPRSQHAHARTRHASSMQPRSQHAHARTRHASSMQPRSQHAHARMRHASCMQAAAAAATQPEVVDTTTSTTGVSARAAYDYARCYCEENVQQLAGRLAEQRRAEQGGSSSTELEALWAVFISSPSKQARACALMRHVMRSVRMCLTKRVVCSNSPHSATHAHYRCRCGARVRAGPTAVVSSYGITMLFSSRRRLSTQ